MTPWSLTRLQLHSCKSGGRFGPKEERFVLSGADWSSEGQWWGSGGGSTSSPLLYLSSGYPISLIQLLHKRSTDLRRDWRLIETSHWDLWSQWDVVKDSSTVEGHIVYRKHMWVHKISKQNTCVSKVSRACAGTASVWACWSLSQGARLFPSGATTSWQRRDGIPGTSSIMFHASRAVAKGSLRWRPGQSGHKEGILVCRTIDKWARRARDEQA